MFNNDSEYAASRLTNSIMKAKDYDTGVIKVLRIYTTSGARAFDKAVVIGYNKDFQETKLSPSQIEFSVGKLGYVNWFGRGTWYVTRMPIRRDYKQGLRYNQLSFKGGDSALRESETETKGFFKALADCLFNKYPPFNTALDLVEDTGNTVAFSRHFAVSNKFSLAHRGAKVGIVTDNGEMRLEKKFSFLEQELELEVKDGKLARY